ncbi:Rv1355c family protein, partial [Mycobacterium kansasii]
MFNAKVAAAAYGVLGPTNLAENRGGTPLRATLTLGTGQDPGLAAIYEPMLARETNRHHGEPTPIPVETIDVLREA